jgi:hypothetical protein
MVAISQCNPGIKGYYSIDFIVEQDLPVQILIVSWHNSPPFFLERELEEEALT